MLIQMETKIENDQDVSGNISEEEYFQWAEDNKKEEKYSGLTVKDIL